MLISDECVNRHQSCFFFQAEDGIRDLVRSRGLGDVYKRQIPYRLNGKNHYRAAPRAPAHERKDRILPQRQRTSVSYTHLTLPTSDLV